MNWASGCELNVLCLEEEGLLAFNFRRKVCFPLVCFLTRRNSVHPSSFKPKSTCDSFPLVVQTTTLFRSLEHNRFPKMMILPTDVSLHLGWKGFTWRRWYLLSWRGLALDRGCFGSRRNNKSPSGPLLPLMLSALTPSVCPGGRHVHCALFSFQGLKNQARVKLNIVRCPPVTTVLIRRPDLRYQLGFSVQNGIVSTSPHPPSLGIHLSRWKNYVRFPA